MKFYAERTEDIEAMQAGVDPEFFASLAGIGGMTSARTINKDEFTVEAMVSTNILDRYGEVMEPKGWRLKNYKRNPIVLLNHNDSELPIGKATDVQIQESGLWARVQYAVKESPRAAEVWNLVLADILRAWSVGWWPLKWEALDGSTKGEGTVYNRQGLRFTEQELWEISQVNIPAGSNAMTLGVSRVAVDMAKRFGVSVDDSLLPDDLGVLSCGVRLLAKSPDLAAAIQNRDDSIVNAAILSTIPSKHVSIYDEDVVLASSLEKLVENIRLASEEIRALA